MDLDEHDRKRLIETLLSNGWVVDGDFVYAPRRTIWFLVSDPWQGDLTDMLERMRARLQRIKRFVASSGEKPEQQETIDDTAQLVDLLEGLGTAA